MFFLRFAFAALTLIAPFAGCAGSTSTDPAGASEPTSLASEALNYRAQCHQRCDATYDIALANCSDPTCDCESQQDHAECAATCDGRNFFRHGCE